MLERIVRETLARRRTACSACVPAAQVNGDDIEIYADESGASCS